MKEKISKLISIILVAPLLFFIIMCICNGFRIPFSEDAILSYYGTMYAGCLSGAITAYALYITIEYNNENSRKQYDLSLFSDQLKDNRRALIIITEINMKIEYLFRCGIHQSYSKETEKNVLELQQLVNGLDIIKKTMLMTYYSEFFNSEEETTNTQRADTEDIKELTNEFISLYIFNFKHKFNKYNWEESLDKLKNCLEGNLKLFNEYLTLAVMAKTQSK